MNWTLLKNVAKWVWLCAIVIFSIYYAVNKSDLILQALSLLSWEILLGVFFLIFLAKLCLVANMWLAASHFSINFGWIDCYRIYNLTQLAKYIPGSIWQFVGRIAILRERGVAAQNIRDSLLAEHLWVMASAAVMGVVLIAASQPDLLHLWFDNFDFNIRLQWVLVGSALVIASAIAVFFLRSHLLRWFLKLRPPVLAMPALLFTWLFLGASLWVTMAPFAEPSPPLAFVIGIYCLAYVAGFLVPFAPAGLGVRETVFALFLMPFINVDIAVLLAAINRILYFSVEIVAVVFCFRAKGFKINKIG
ncbi:lysylphosphatidylglycerol synthase domain-containing protein [Billgrantia kenyensis]|uniref:Flippase-like domain-containing protein n=1 Tax=Billgrantia kenyensis TaxID=321266 RepID=A0A7V9W0X7_9GAMM|nr:lysylphosphatidylglycerol synthase domain-containing protein [Halomonas kenyensis]MBA2778993.1 flippase-like domain-containing protein [Halomonas kenyensis]MCG6662920.1 hypothetical protein [Halomonas kenyensis]